MPGRILIVDDVATNRIVMKVKLASACYTVMQAGNGADALAIAQRDKPDLILLDVMMPDMNGVDLCKALKSNPKTLNIPVVMVAAIDDGKEKLRALRAGADEFLTKPINEIALLARVRSLLRERDTAEELHLYDGTSVAIGFAEPAATFAKPLTIALIANDEKTALRWKSGLTGKLTGPCAATLRVVAAHNALAQAETAPPPDIFVLEGGTGHPNDQPHLISELRSRTATRHAAIVVVVPKMTGTGQNTARDTVTALDLGANDILTDGFDTEEMALRLGTQIRRKRRADRLRETLKTGLRLAVTDPLTGLYNRRYAMPHLDRIAARANEVQKPFALMLLDLDRFKLVNDTYGHPTGDAVLHEVAQRLLGHLRDVDLVARIGGEEFLVVMPDTNLDEAKSAAERLRRLINDSPIELSSAVAPASVTPSAKTLSVSLSIGVAMGGVDGGSVGAHAGAGVSKARSPEEVFQQADRALYAAKTDGRNQVMVSRSAA